jgi:hypothetical protein
MNGEAITNQEQINPTQIIHSCDTVVWKDARIS